MDALSTLLLLIIVLLRFDQMKELQGGYLFFTAEKQREKGRSCNTG